MVITRKKYKALREENARNWKLAKYVGDALEQAIAENNQQAEQIADLSVKLDRLSGENRRLRNAIENLVEKNKKPTVDLWAADMEDE